MNQVRSPGKWQLLIINVRLPVYPELFGDKSGVCGAKLLNKDTKNYRRKGERMDGRKEGNS